jgi:exportin-T
MDQPNLLPLVRSKLYYLSLKPDSRYCTVLRNKFSHTLTLFFLCTYVEQWSTFFTDLFVLIRPAESSSQPTYNRHISLLFFHIVLEISGEVADNMIKSARTYNAVRNTRDARVRDAVRERDAARINEAVLTIVADGTEKMSRLRKNGGSSESERELDGVVEVVDWGIRTFGSYVGMSMVRCCVFMLMLGFFRLDRHQLDRHSDNRATVVYLII